MWSITWSCMETCCDRCLFLNMARVPIEMMLEVAEAGVRQKQPAIVMAHAVLLGDAIATVKLDPLCGDKLSAACHLGLTA
jgi:hypothetical protein